MESGVAIAVAILRDAYPRADFPQRSAELYGRMLADLDDLLVVEAVRRLIRREKFLPSIAEIRREVAEAVLQLPTPTEAWEMVNSQRYRNALPSLVMQSLHALGGRWALQTTDVPSIFMTQFVKDYTVRREQAVIEVMGASTLASLQPSQAITPRPVFARLERRIRGEDLTPANDAEKADAIRVLEAGPQTPDAADDHLYVEAQRILDEGA